MAKRNSSVDKLRSSSKNLRALAAILGLTAMAACSSPEDRVEKYGKSGQAYLEKEDFGKANVQFQNALKIDEAHVPTLLGLAEIAEKRQDFKSMFALLQKIVRLDPQNVDATVKLGKLYLIGSDETAAMEYADTALALDPDDIGALGLKSAVLLKVGDNAGAVELARRVTATDPANPEAVTVLATERVIAEAPEEAIAEIDKALATNEKIAILQLLRIRILSMVGRDEEVSAGFKKLIKIFPEELGYRRVYASDLVRQEDFAAALQQVEELVVLDPTNIDAKLDIIRISKKHEGDAKAKQRLKAFATAEPDNSALQFALADYYRQTLEFDAAKKIYETLTVSSDDDVARSAKVKIAALIMRDGDRDSAKAYIDDVLEDDESNTDALIMRAGLLIDAKDYDNAILDLRTALSNRPDDTTAILLMASAFERNGDVELAEAQMLKAIEASENIASVANVFAKFLMRQKKSDRAEEVLVKSLAAHPGDPANLKFLAALRLARQDWKGAEELATILDSVATDAAADNIRTVAYSGLKDYDRLIDSLTEKSEQAPLESRPLAMLVMAYLQSDRAAEAEEMLNRMISNDQGGAFNERVLLAQVLFHDKRMDEAESTLLAATAADPGRTEAYEMLYRYYLAQDNRAKADKLIEDGLARAPANQALRVFKADMLLSNSQYAEAFDIYAELVKERPNDKIVVNNYVSLAADLRNDEQTIAKALEAAKILEGEDNPFFKDTLGWAYYRAGDHAKALPLLKDAAANSENAEILYHLGAVYLANNDNANARETLEKAIAVGGANFRYKSQVEDLLQRV